MSVQFISRRSSERYLFQASKLFFVQIPYFTVRLGNSTHSSFTFDSGTFQLTVETAWKTACIIYYYELKAI